MTFWEIHITRLNHEGIKHAGAREVLIFLAEESNKQEGSNRHVLINTHSASDPRTLIKQVRDPERKISSTMFAIVCLQYCLRRSEFDRKRHEKVAPAFFVHVNQDFFHISRTWHSRIHQLQVNHKDLSSRSNTPLNPSGSAGHSDKHVCLNSVMSGPAPAQAGGIPPDSSTHTASLNPGEKGTSRCTRVPTCSGYQYPRIRDHQSIEQNP